MAGEISNPNNPNMKSQKSPLVKVFNCPSCGGSISIRAVGQSVNAICSSCAAIIDSSNENFKVVEQATLKSKRKQIIPLGQRGKLRGTIWEVIGYLERRDGSANYQWSEYLLYNPLKGFRWLTELDGHWNLVLITKSKPELKTNFSETESTRYQVVHLGKRYSLFNKGSVVVTHVMGEFYWQVRINEKVHVEEYVCPPEILSCEKNDNEEIWSLGEYVKREEIKSAFEIKTEMPPLNGVSPNEPSLISDSNKDIREYWGMFVGIIFILQIIFLASADNKVVYRGSFNFDKNAPESEKTKVTTPFEITNDLSNLEIKLHAPVQNNWFEVQGELVNDESGEILDFENGVEYYSGYDIDGNWSEGQQTNSIILSSVPLGKYHLNLESSTDSFYGINADFIVTNDVPTWSNFLWSVILISLFMLVVWWKGRSFEVNRWSQSDFSPFFEHQGD